MKIFITSGPDNRFSILPESLTCAFEDQHLCGYVHDLGWVRMQSDNGMSIF